MKKNKSYNKTKSRKWYLVLLVLWISVLMTVVPPLVSVWVFKSDKPTIILTGTEFVSLLTLIVSCYFGANVVQKHVEYKNGINNNLIDENITEDPDEGKEA